MVELGTENDRGIDNTAFPQHQAVLFEVFVDLGEKFLAQLVLLKQIAGSSGPSSRRAPCRVGLPRSGAWIQSRRAHFHRGIIEVVDQLHDVNTQHRSAYGGLPVPPRA